MRGWPPYIPRYQLVEEQFLPNWFFDAVIWPQEGPPTVWLGEEVVFSRNEKTAEIAGSADLKNGEIFINKTSIDTWQKSRKSITLAHEAAHFCSRKHSHHGINFLFVFGCLLSSAGMSRVDIWVELFADSPRLDHEISFFLTNLNHVVDQMEQQQTTQSGSRWLGEADVQERWY